MKEITINKVKIWNINVRGRTYICTPPRVNNASQTPPTLQPLKASCQTKFDNPTTKKTSLGNRSTIAYYDDTPNHSINLIASKRDA